jgi:phosphoglucomutase
VNEQVKVAIAHDCRNNSRFFAETTAHVFAANGTKSIICLKTCGQHPNFHLPSGTLVVMAEWFVTASHNPKEYNGYKAYWD